MRALPNRVSARPGGQSFRLRKIWYKIALERSGNFVAKCPDIYFKICEICTEMNGSGGV